MHVKWDKFKRGKSVIWKNVCYNKITCDIKRLTHLYKIKKLANSKLIWHCYLYLYNNVTFVCIFIGCWPWSIKDTHTDGVSGFVFLFSCPPPKVFQWTVWIDRLHISVRVYCNRSQKTSQRVKNKMYDTRWRRVAWLLFFTHGKTHDLLQHSIALISAVA